MIEIFGSWSEMGRRRKDSFGRSRWLRNFHSVGRLNLIVDRNRIQNDDFVEVQMEVGDVAKKLSSFGWDVKEIDGHSMEEVVLHSGGRQVILDLQPQL